MTTTRTFLEAYVDAVESCLPNDFADNFDYLRFSEAKPIEHGKTWKDIVRDILKRRGYVPAHSLKQLSLVPFRLIAPYVHRLQRIYTLLADDESRQLLVYLLAYRALGHRKVKLPLSTPEYWRNIQSVDQFAEKSDYIQVPFMDWKLSRMRLDALGFPIDIYFTAKGAYTQFGLQQYRCMHEDGVIQAEPGDCVIDGGACWGDTVLYFAHKVGDNGRVFSFEFIPSNLAILDRNLRLNPSQSQRVTIVENALWSSSDLPIWYTDGGPGSRVSLEELSNGSGQTSTLAIDDLVQRNDLARVDFIKMDIEGAELQALKGAAETIKRYKPKLAISIYHRLEDFMAIPEYIASFDIGYRFFIRHFTIHAEETVFFAEAERA